MNGPFLLAVDEDGGAPPHHDLRRPLHHQQVLVSLEILVLAGLVDRHLVLDERVEGDLGDLLPLVPGGQFN